MTASKLKYEGAFNDTVTNQLVTLVDAAFGENQVDPRTRGHLKALLVEQVQNVQRYSSDVRTGSVEVSQERDQLVIETVNAIESAAQDAIGSQLDTLLSTDKETLRQLFRSAMHEPPSPDKSGAGLGFIMLSRHSRKPLEYRFDKDGDCRVLFRLKCYV